MTSRRAAAQSGSSIEPSRPASHATVPSRVSLRQKIGTVPLPGGFVQPRDATGKIGQAVARVREVQP